MEILVNAYRFHKEIRKGRFRVLGSSSMKSFLEPPIGGLVGYDSSVSKITGRGNGTASLSMSESTDARLNRDAYSRRYTLLLSRGFFSVCFISDPGGELTRPRPRPSRLQDGHTYTYTRARVHRQPDDSADFDSASHYNYYNGTFNLTPRVD